MEAIMNREHQVAENPAFRLAPLDSLKKRGSAGSGIHSPMAPLKK